MMFTEVWTTSIKQGLRITEIKKTYPIAYDNSVLTLNSFCSFHDNLFYLLNESCHSMLPSRVPKIDPALTQK